MKIYGQVMSTGRYSRYVNMVACNCTPETDMDIGTLHSVCKFLHIANLNADTFF